MLGVAVVDARPGRRVSTVRPFAARVVHQDWAAHAVDGALRGSRRRRPPRPGTRSTPRRTTSRRPRSTSTGSNVGTSTHRGGVRGAPSRPSWTDACAARGGPGAPGRDPVAAPRDDCGPAGSGRPVHAPGTAFTQTLTLPAALPILDFPGPAELQQTVLAGPTGLGHRSPRPRARHRRSLHRRRAPPGRRGAEGVAPRSAGRPTQDCSACPRDGRPAAVRVPSPADRAGGPGGALPAAVSRVPGESGSCAARTVGRIVRSVRRWQLVPGEPSAWGRRRRRWPRRGGPPRAGPRIPAVRHRDRPWPGRPSTS